MLIRIAALLVFVLSSSGAHARALLVCDVGGPGTTAQAQAAVDAFLRHLEGQGAFPQRSLEGVYHSRREACLRYLSAKGPQLAVFDLASYLSLQAEWKLRAIAHMGDHQRQRYHLLVRRGSFADLAKLRGGVLASNLLADPVFVSRILFEGRVDVTEYFQIQHTRRPLQGIRKVARGRADATLVDAAAFAHLGELDLPVPLESIHASPRLPGLVLALVERKGRAPQDLETGVMAALGALCKGDGAALCQAQQVSEFVVADGDYFRGLQERYQGPSPTPSEASRPK